MKVQTIQIHLAQGEAQGIRFAEISTRTIECIYIPRAKINDLDNFKELTQVGLYFLIGDEQSLYIGESENCLNRLKQHHKLKDFWHTAIVVVSKTNNFSKSHAKYLEYHCTLKCLETNQFNLLNSNKCNEPNVNKMTRTEIFDAYETLNIILSVLGFPIFENVKKSESNSEMLFCKSQTSERKAFYNEFGLTVLKGSKASLSTTNSFPSSSKIKRAELLAQSILVEQDQHLIFTKDYSFKTPSAASDVILGRSSNGWVSWKNEQGSTLSDLVRK